MKAVRVELVARDAFRVVLGSVVVSATTSGIACLDNWSAVKAVTDTGTSCSVSWRRRAVTTTFSTLPSATALPMPDSWAWALPMVPSAGEDEQGGRGAAQQLPVGQPRLLLANTH
jgi:hypothetical protein